MRVNEIFQSIQGEGQTAGKAVTFVRMQGCNLHCSFCDTKYAIPDQGFQEDWTLFTSLDLSLTLDELPPHGNTIVWTGGEPMLQIQGILGTINMLTGSFNHELETNGTIIPEHPEVFSLITVSPKGEIDYEAWKRIAQTVEVQFKFVAENVEEVLPIIEEWDLSREKVWIMPLTSPMRNVLECHRWIADQCVQEGLNFSPRLQTLFRWGRGQ